MGKQSNNCKDHIACHTCPSVVVLSLLYRLSDLEGEHLHFPASFKDQQVVARAGCFVSLSPYIQMSKFIAFDYLIF